MMSKREEEYDAFVSYSQEDRPIVSSIVSRIRQRRHPVTKKKLRVFLDSDSLRVGDNWVTQIEAALTNSSCIIPFFSTAYLNSKAANWELLQKHIIDLNAQDKLVLPCVIEDCEIPSRLKHIHYLDFRRHINDESPLFKYKIDELANAIKGTPRKRVQNTTKSKQRHRHIPTLPYYVYISDSKVDMLISWTRTRNSFQEDAASRHEKLPSIVDALFEFGQVGSIGSSKPFFSGDYEMQWGVIDWGVCDHDVSCSIFFTLETDPMLLLFGSSYHVIGTTTSKYDFPPRAFGFSGSHLPGILRVIGAIGGVDDLEDNYLFIKWLEEDKFTDEDGKPRPMHLPRQKLNFIAKRLSEIRRPSEPEFLKWIDKRTRYVYDEKGQYDKERQKLIKDQLLDRFRAIKGNVLIGSPIYAALSE